MRSMPSASRSRPLSTSTIEPLPQFFFRMGYTNAAGRDGGTAYDVFHNSEPNRWIKAPATIDHRFFNEDVPYGLVAIAELGRVGRRADAVRGRSHRYCLDRRRASRTASDGLTRERMGIAGMTAAEVTALLRTGREMSRDLEPSSPWKRGSIFRIRGAEHNGSPLPGTQLSAPASSLPRRGGYRGFVDNDPCRP